MLYNRLIENILLPFSDQILGTTFHKELVKLRDQQYLSNNEIENLQSENIYSLLRFSLDNIPYYRKLNISFDSDPYKWVKKFPVLTKSIIKQYNNELIKPEEGRLYKHSSSGSTGEQSTVFMNELDQSKYRATQILWWEWAGFRLGDKFLQTGINPNRGLLKLCKDFLLRTKYISAFNHSEEDIIKILKKLPKSGYSFGGYASSLYVFAQVAKRAGINNVNLKATISWGDKLFDHYRNQIESTFNTKVHETYGCAEGILIAAQKDLPYMYIMSNNVFLEIVDDQGNELPDGEMGHVLVTRLDSRAMPLIRYRLGDLAIKLPKNEYPCKRDLNFPLLKKVIGRDTDIVKTKSGKYMVVHFFTGIFEHIPAIKQFRVIQTTLDKMEIEYIPDKSFNKSILKHIEWQIHKHLKEEFPIIFIKVDYIPSTNSGKPQLISSSLSIV